MFWYKFSTPHHSTRTKVRLLGRRSKLSHVYIKKFRNSTTPLPRQASSSGQNRWQSSLVIVLMLQSYGVCCRHKNMFLNNLHSLETVSGIPCFLETQGVPLLTIPHSCAWQRFTRTHDKAPLIDYSAACENRQKTYKLTPSFSPFFPLHFEVPQNRCKKRVSTIFFGVSE